MNLSVMSFNIRYGTARDGKNSWHIRRPLVIKTILTNPCDIIGIQEGLSFQLSEILRLCPDYGCIGVGRGDGIDSGEHTAIFYNKSKFALIEHATFWFSDTPNIPGSCSWGNRIPRICTWALLQNRKHKIEFYIYNLHLDHQSQNARQKSCEALIQRICNNNPDTPVVVTGDFNAIESNSIIQYLKGKRSTKSGESNAFPLIDTYRSIYPKTLGGTLHLFRGLRYGPRIDYIFVDHRFKVRSAEIVKTNFDKRYPSDHFPITTLLEY